jgi:hypothetical protein
MMNTNRAEFSLNAEAFNAKYLAASEVADGFVYSSHFERLAGDYHAVLVGPRGSGKTTLLKMLQPAALAAWTGSHSEKFRQAIRYTGVFIASDISWSKQLNSLGYGKLSQQNHRILVLACFTTHVIHAVLEAMANRLHSTHEYRKVSLSGEQESLLVRELASVLRVKPDISSLLSVRQSIRNRLSDIRVVANACSLLADGQCSERLSTIEFLHLDFLDVASNICTMFNEAVGEAGATWSLLFDELETAPEWIIEQLFSAVRSSDPKLFLKLAISPVSSTAFRALFKQDGAVHRNDHEQIRLWYSDRADSKAFCRALWNSLTQKHGLNITAEEALGRSVFEPRDNRSVRRRSPYSAGEPWHDIFTRLQKKDKSFVSFLKAKNIDLDAAETLWLNKRDDVLRKAAPVAAVRDFYLHESKRGEVTARQRKTLELYAGADSIFAVTEGNPRWFIGLASPLINFLVASHGRKKVPNSEQAKEIDAAADRLLALMKTIPVERENLRGDEVALDALLENIGTKLHAELVEEPFAIDPALTFVVDEDTPPGTRELLASAVNRGAVVLVDESSTKAILDGMLNAKLRLSFLLAAKYGLLLRKGKAVRLSNILRPRRPSSAQAEQGKFSFDAD